MKKNSLLSSVLITFLILGAGCNSSSPTRSVSGTSSVGESASTISETSTKSNNPGSEYRYYAGTIGAKKARLIYWSDGPDRPNESFFEGMYVYEGESTEPLRLKISFTSGGHFMASGYHLTKGEEESDGINWESTDDCDGKNEQGVLCGELTGIQGTKKMSFNFTKTDKFNLENYLKK